MKKLTLSSHARTIPFSLSLFAAISLTALSMQAHASTIDQSFLSPESGGARVGGSSLTSTSGAAQAQTFTAGISGVFDTATIVLSSFMDTTTDVTLSLWSLGGSGGPGSELGTAFVNTATLLTPNVSTQVTYDFSSLGLSMLAGTQYALVATHGAGFGTSWRADPTGNGYADGQRWSAGYDTTSDTFGIWGGAPSWDFLFETTVNPVPVPGAVWLFGSGLIGLVGIARRKKV